MEFLIIIIISYHRARRHTRSSRSGLNQHSVSLRCLATIQLFHSAEPGFTALLLGQYIIEYF